MLTFNIWGNCMSRQILNIIEAKKWGKVLQYVGVAVSHPISAFSDKCEREISMDDLSEYKGGNFEKRCFCQDINKTALEYLITKKSDYLIVDWIAIQQPMYKKKGHYMVTGSPYVYNKEKIHTDFNLDSYEYIMPYDIDIEVWREYIGKFCDFISRFYTPKQIILNECLRSEEYKCDDPEKPLKTFNAERNSYTKKYNELVKKINSFFLEKIPGCHVIDFCTGAIADTANPLGGPDPLHYEKTYYEYGARAIEVICAGYEDSREREILNDLRILYSEKCKLLKEKLEFQNKFYGTNSALYHTKTMLFDIFGQEKFIEWLKEQKSNNSKISVLVSGYVVGQIFVKALNKYDIVPLLTSPKVRFSDLTNEELELCKQSDIVVYCGSVTPEYDNINAIKILDLFEDKREQNKKP